MTPDEWQEVRKVFYAEEWKRLKNAFYLTIGYKFAYRYYNIKRPLVELLYRFPKFKVGDYVEFDLNYAKVVYRVEAIKKSQHRWYGVFLYELKGVKILSQDGTNPHMTEAKRYNPFCHYFDETAKLYEGPLSNKNTKASR